MSIGQVWSTVLDVDENDTAALLRAIADLIALVREAEEAAKQLSGDTELYLRPFPNIRSLFNTINLGIKWGTVRNSLDEPTIVALQFDARLFEQATETLDVTDEEIADLQSRVESLLDEILGSELADELKTVLVQKLEEMRSAIVLYRLRGIEGLQSVIDSTLSVLWRHTEQIEKARETKDWVLLNKIVNLLANACQIFQVVYPALPAASNVIVGLLGAGR